ncbi:MetS family NSS transporter small subunit [Selenihalanaerobacter shriftii]|nr:MetS family NSS transporter small subunit [Selenihalanaerobacter shriftii]
MSISAWMMLIFAIVVLFGGLGICLNIAIKN